MLSVGGGPVLAVAVLGPEQLQAFVVGMLALTPSHWDRSSAGGGSEARQ